MSAATQMDCFLKKKSNSFLAIMGMRRKTILQCGRSADRKIPQGNPSPPPFFNSTLKLTARPFRTVNFCFLAVVFAILGLFVYLLLFSFVIICFHPIAWLQFLHPCWSYFPCLHVVVLGAQQAERESKLLPDHNAAKRVSQESSEKHQHHQNQGCTISWSKKWCF